jgi:hypothetical protein
MKAIVLTDVRLPDRGALLRWFQGVRQERRGMAPFSRRSGYSTSAHEAARTGRDHPARQAARLRSVADAP